MNRHASSMTQSFSLAASLGSWMRVVTRPTITDSGYCMALNLGLDNRHLLPPFLPVQRNQDGVFAAVLTLCGSGCTGFLPWMVLRAP